MNARAWYNWVMGPSKYPPLMPQNGCAVTAMAHLGDLDEKSARQLVTRARNHPNKFTEHQTLLTERGTAKAMLWADNLAAWAALAGVKIVEKTRTIKARALKRDPVFYKKMGYVRRTTVKTFIRTHKRGRYLVDVPGHVFAVINGKAWGDYKPLSLVNSFVRVEIIK